MLCKRPGTLGHKSSGTTDVELISAVTKQRPQL